jgi:hypothetical protein
LATDEKRMVVILPFDSYDTLLRATSDGSMEFMRQYSAEHLQTVPTRG